MPIPAPTFLGRRRLRALQMEDVTLGAGLLGTTAQDRNLSWIFWLVLPFAARDTTCTGQSRAGPPGQGLRPPFCRS